jgi:hypothetical protein
VALFPKVVEKVCTGTDTPYIIEYGVHFFYMENDVEIFPAHYTWKVAENGIKMACMMNKCAMINS